MSDDTTLDPAFLAAIPENQREFFELMTRDEPLHPDLLPYVTEVKSFGQMLRHPLVYEIGIHGPARINKRYAAVTEALAKARKDANWHKFIWLHERPWRQDALRQIESHLRPAEYWTHVRDVWIDSENVWQNFAEWVDMLNDPRPAQSQIMTAPERKALRALPETVKVYRGCQLNLNDDGLSWTLDYNLALWFATRHVISTSDDENEDQSPVVLHGEVPRSKILAYFKEGRGEEEIVVRHPVHVKVVVIEVVVV